MGRLDHRVRIVVRHDCGRLLAVGDRRGAQCFPGNAAREVMMLLLSSDTARGLRLVASDYALWAVVRRCGWRRTEECLGWAELSSKCALKEWKRVLDTRENKAGSVI
jgi:hypothetical protein